MKSRVEVLLREHVSNLGRCGDVVQVAPGYARNYLIPRKLAIQATEDNKRAMLRRRTRLDADEARKAKETLARVEVLNGVVLKTSGRADESGQLFGSVNAARICELLAAAGHAVAQDDVRLESPLKTVGAHEVRIHVHGETFASIKVEVEAEA
ncbi:MAG: 50S ribosomal protein L9 [Planctomycetota bacterium]